MKKILFLCLALSPMFLHADTSSIRFTDGWIKQLPPVVPVRAGYIQINNPSKQDHQIVGVQSDAFERVEIHESKMQDGVMIMDRILSLTLPAASQVELKPGGIHLMLMNPIQSLQIGDRFDVVITFEDETSKNVRFEVRK